MTAVMTCNARSAELSVGKQSSDFADVHADNDHRYDVSIARAPELISGPVVVITASASDSRYVVSLLGHAGLENSEINVCGSPLTRSMDIRALVLLHRSTDEVGFDSHFESEIEHYKSIRKIVLTRCELEETTVKFLEQGARHCIKLNEPDAILRARLQAALRVHPGTAQRSFSVGDIFFDIQKRKASRAGVEIDLSPKEFEFARYLFSNPDKIVGNAELMTSVWSLPVTMDSRRIDTAACRVRKKLRLSGDDGWKLKRIRRIGYHLQAV